MHVADGIERFEDQGVVNSYLVQTSEGPVAIDAAFPTAWEQVEPYVHDLRAIILTHGHIDHCGFAPKAQKQAGVPVYVPHGDEPIVRSPLPMAESEGSPLKYVVKESATRSLYLKALKAGDTLPGGFRAIGTPGHTDGHRTSSRTSRRSTASPRPVRRTC